MIKGILLAATLAAASLSGQAQAQVGVSLSVGEPGFYGQINIGGAPAPQLVYPQPVVIAPSPQYAGAPPIYLRVPPGQAKKWGSYCGRYNACGRRVYFVRDDWYTNRYVPYYRSHHGKPGGPAHDHRGHDRGHGHGPDHHGR